MTALATGLIPQATLAIEKTRRAASSAPERSAGLAEVIARQTDVVAKMKEILEHMVQPEGFQEAVNLLSEIEKVQTDVYQQTNKAREERIKRILEGDSGGASATPKP